ncbi:MAG TPA: hypothetical protein VGE22_12370 [Solimonas sp.]
MATVTIPESLGGTGTTYSDGTGENGMASRSGYGYAELLIPMLSEVVTAGATVVDKALQVAQDTEAAATSATAAEASRDAIDNRIYPGTYASDPTTRPDGSAIQEGDEYTGTDGYRYARIDGAWVASLGVNFRYQGGALVIGDQSVSAGTAGVGSVLIGGYDNLQKHRLPGSRMLRAIIGGYDCEISGGADGDTGGLACIIAGSHHSAINGSATHCSIFGGSYNVVDGGDYSAIGGGTLNKIHTDTPGGDPLGYDPNTSVVAGGYNNHLHGANSSMLGGRSNEVWGSYVTLGAGKDCKAHGDFTVVAGGGENEARLGASGSGYRNVIGGGRFNIIDAATNARYNVIVGGDSNEAWGMYNAVGGGSTNKAGTSSGSITYGVIGGGLANQVTAANAAAVLGGHTNAAAGDYSSVTGGRETSTTTTYARAHGHQAVGRHLAGDTIANGAFATPGDAQTSVVVRKLQTTDATQGSMTTITLPNDSAYLFSALVVARRADADGESAGYRIEGVIDRGSTAGSTAFVGTPAVTVIAEDTSAWDVVVALNTGSGGFQIRVTGENGKTINWVARVTLVEVTG